MTQRQVASGSSGRRRGWRLALSGLALGLLGTGCATARAAQPTAQEGFAMGFYVAVNGNDAWSGSLPDPSANGADGPFRTLERAREAVRALKAAGALPKGGVSVTLRGGRHELQQPFTLEAADSGTAEAPITYQAAGGEEVRLIGGRTISGWQPVDNPAILDRLDPAARGKVMQTDLRAQGLTDFPPLTAPNWAQSDAGLELFFRDTPMTLARWPNEGYSRIAELCVQDGWKIHNVPGSRVGQFVYEGDRPARWAAEKDIWLHGYWFWDWADQRLRVAAIDTTQKTITLAKEPVHSYGFRKGQWYYAFGLLCELDTPGEWYLDREAGMLYFWPPEGIREGDTLVSVISNPIQLREVAHVTLSGLIVEAARGTAITLTGGSRCEVRGCVLRNLGKAGVEVNGGTSHRVVGCDLYQLGEGGIAMTGGDRRTLTPGEHVAENNHIHHCSRWNLLYKPGIQLTGVGLSATHNLLHDLPHVAIGFTGNEHTIDFNEIHSVVYQANDAGAVYTTGASETWTMRGHVIRYNYLHHIYGFEGRGCMGVYLDDAFSSIHLYGNLFQEVPRAAFIGGGRDSLIENNVFVDCNPALHIDSRGLGWMAGSKDGLISELKSLPYLQPPWSVRYPQLATLLVDDPMAPKGNVVARNLQVGGRWDEIDGRSRPLVTFTDNLLGEDPLFVNAARGDFRLRPESPAWALGFKEIPLQRIGLYASPERASWPVQHRLRERPPTPPAAAPVSAARLKPAQQYRVPPKAAAIAIDGNLTAAEWAGLDPQRGIRIAQGLAGEALEPASLAWLSRDETALYLAVDNPVDPTQPIRSGEQWGADDAVEVAVRNPALGKTAPILVLRGYPSGKFESSAEAGAPEAAVKRAATGVEYAARIVTPSRWTAEWRIPFAALGVDPALHERLEFNLSVRKPTDDKWLLWQATGQYTWLVGNAGIILLGPDTKLPSK